MRKYLCPAVGLITVVAAGLALGAPATASARGMAHRATDCFKVTATTPLATAPDAVAVNPATNTIYVASFEAGTVSVIDGQTNTVTATIRVARSPQGITVGPRSKDIYVAGGITSTVSVIRGQTNTVFATIRLPEHSLPEGLATDSETNTIYAADNGSDTVSAIAVCPK